MRAVLSAAAALCALLPLAASGGLPARAAGPVAGPATATTEAGAVPEPGASGLAPAPDTVTCDGRETGADEGGEATDAGREATDAGGGEAASTGDTDPLPERPDGEELMRRAEAVYDTLRTLRARFRQTIEMRVFEPPRRREGSGTWYQEKPARFRMDFSDPEEDLIVSDGEHLWLFYPSTHPGQVIRSEMGSEGRGAAMVDLQGRIFLLARTRYDVTYAGRDSLDGVPVHRVELSPRSPEAAYRGVEVWLDAGSLLVRRLVLEDRSETVRTVTLDDLRTGVSLPDSLFDFRVPEGVEVFEG